MIEDLEHAHLIRQSRRAQRLGVPAPICMACMCASIEALIGVPFRLLPVWMQRRIIELHHLEGQAIDPDWVVPLCRNCHALATERRRDLPGEILRPRTPRERLMADLQGIEDWAQIVEQGVQAVRDRAKRVKEYLLAHPDEGERHDGRGR